jgi:hypothetical protein
MGFREDVRAASLTLSAKLGSTKKPFFVDRPIAD